MACSPAPRASRRRRKRPSSAALRARQYDPCYHLACDTYANNNDVALDNNSDAIAYSVISYAMSTELINGTKSKGNFKPPADPAAPLAA